MHTHLLLLGAALLFHYVVYWLGKRFVRKYIFKGPLENIPGPPSASFITGNMLQCFNRDGLKFHQEIAERYGGIVKLNGMFGDPVLYVFDPKALLHITTKDQYGYERATGFIKIIFGEGLLLASADQHKRGRKMLAPAFSSAHLKEIVPVFWEVSRKLCNTLASQTKNGETEIDIAVWMARTSLEMVGQGGLGYSFDPLTWEAPTHPYGKASKELVPAIARVSAFRTILLPLVKLGSPTFRRWLVDISPFESVNKLRDVTDVMHGTSVEIFEDRRRALVQGGELLKTQVAQGKDIMSLLLKSNMQAADEDRLPEHELLAQISTLTFAGMDTTSSALARMFHLMCLYPDVQEKLRAEIMQAVSANGELSYEELLGSLPYVDAFCRETLRLYPSVSLLSRTAKEDAVLPLSRPIKGVNGQDISEIYVPKGTTIFTSLISANRNKRVWGEDAEDFNPDRWLNPLPDTVKDANMPGIYAHLMTFFGGARACIGFKFALLEIKVVLIALLKSFKFSLSDKDIFWAMNGSFTPTVVGGDPEKPSLPMNISAI